MNRFTMVEFPSADAAASAQFFANAFAWDHLAYGPEYMDVQMGGGQALGFQQDTAHAPAAPLAVIEVDDLERAKRDVENAGGQITVPEFSFPGGRRFHFREPGGNELAAWVRAAQEV